MTDKSHDQSQGGQLLLPGTVTEWEVYKSVLRRVSAKGGNANTLAQKIARTNNMIKLNARRRERMAKK